MTVVAHPKEPDTVTPAPPSQPLSRDEWIARELAKAPRLTGAQNKALRRAKQDLTRIATAR